MADGSGSGKMAIKSVLREELGNSLRMAQSYLRELARLPQGSLVRRCIKGHLYYYLVFREAGKFRAVYRGKQVPPADVGFRFREERGDQGPVKAQAPR